jgi:anti-sigma B factor antagonist
LPNYRKPLIRPNLLSLIDSSKVVVQIIGNAICREGSSAKILPEIGAKASTRGYKIRTIRWQPSNTGVQIFEVCLARRLAMGTNAFRAPGLKLELEETAEETTVHCSGRITAESAEMFQSEIRDRVIPISRGKGVAVTRRIVLDLSQVTFIDSTGLGALLSVWTAGQRRSCDMEIVNLSPRVEKLVNLTKLDQVFNKMKGLFGGK